MKFYLFMTILTLAGISAAKLGETNNYWYFAGWLLGVFILSIMYRLEENE